MIQVIKVFTLYEVNPTTWFYISSLMIIGIFFKFRRVWSIRNQDLIMLLFLAPGMLMVANHYEYLGYCFIFAVSFILLMRMICDPFLVRRPLLEVNLSRSGMTFSCIAMMVFLIAGLILTQWREAASPQTATLQQLLRAEHIDRILAQEKELASQEEENAGNTPSSSNLPLVTHAPGVPFFSAFANLPMKYLINQERNRRAEESAHAAEENPSPEDSAGAAESVKRVPEFPILKGQDRQFRMAILSTHTMAILGQIAIILGIIFIGSVHFENLGTGIAAATLYLLLPYSAQIPARIDHIIPAALIVWAVFCYRRPALSGVLLGCAAAFAYYPIFMIPLWAGFYWSRGFLRFTMVSLCTFAGLMVIAILAVGGIQPFISQMADTFAFAGVLSRTAGGFWNHNLFFRIPVIALYVILATVLAFWPSQKNLGTLMSSSAALMVGAQFCHPFEGGLYMAWFLPLMILVIFRPNLEDRIAIRALAKRTSPYNEMLQDGD